MILSLAAVIVEQYLAAIELTDQDGRSRRQHEREVRSGKHVNDVVLVNASQQTQPVSDRRDYRADILDSLQMMQTRRQLRIDRQKPDLQRWLFLQTVH